MRTSACSQMCRWCVAGGGGGGAAAARCNANPRVRGRGWGPQDATRAGGGAYGLVHTGTWHGTPVAVRARTHVAHASEKSRRHVRSRRVCEWCGDVQVKLVLVHGPGRSSLTKDDAWRELEVCAGVLAVVAVAGDWVGSV